MLALCAKAAREAYGGGRSGATRRRQRRGRSGAIGDRLSAEPVAVSADFLSAPDPGPVQLVTTVRKRGRRIGLVDVELDQGGRTCVRAVVTLGEPEHLAEPLLSANPVDTADGRRNRRPGSSRSARAILPRRSTTWPRGCDIRPALEQSYTAAGAPVFKIWVRPKDGPVDVLFALMCGDISVPAASR